MVKVNDKCPQMVDRIQEYIDRRSREKYKERQFSKNSGTLLGDGTHL